MFQASANSTPKQANVVATQPSFSFSFQDETAIGLESELADNATRDHHHANDVVMMVSRQTGRQAGRQAGGRGAGQSKSSLGVASRVECGGERASWIWIWLSSPAFPAIKSSSEIASQ